MLKNLVVCKLAGPAAEVTFTVTIELDGVETPQAAWGLITTHDGCEHDIADALDLLDYTRTLSWSRWLTATCIPPKH